MMDIKRSLLLATMLTLSHIVLGQDTITLAFIGDVMQHQRQLHTARIKGEDTLDSKSYDYSSYFKYTRHILSEADYAVANMEFVCGLPPYTGYPAFSAPFSLAQATKDAGIDLFLCANNHIFDKGQRGFEKTLESYDSLNIDYTGVYRSREDRDSLTPHIADIRGVKVAFINFTYGTNLAAQKGVANRMDTTLVTNAMANARKRGAEIVIALPHWGVEYSLAPSAQQKNWEEFLYRKGADAIIGGHPHVVQPINTIRGENGEIRHITAYSLGNFISNMSAKNTQTGFIFVLKLVSDSGGVRIASGEPIWIWCARGGRLERNYTTIPIEDFIGRPEKFPIRYEYDNMVETYNRLKEIITNGN